MDNREISNNPGLLGILLAVDSDRFAIKVLELPQNIVSIRLPVEHKDRLMETFNPLGEGPLVSEIYHFVP
jgi:hypothetical protein